MARWLAAACLAVCCVLAALPTPAHAADATHVDVALTSITLSGTKPTDEVTLDATITNTGTTDAFGVQALLWRSRVPITDPATLPPPLDADAFTSTSDWGTGLAWTPEHYKLITNSTTPFPPGASYTLTMRATLADLGFLTSDAAYLVGLRVIGTPDASSRYVTIGEARANVPLPGDQPVPVTSVVVLSSQPTKISDNLFANDSLGAELRGRLGDLLTAAEEDGLSYLIDPALLDEVADQADGYNVHTGRGDVTGANQDIARDWLTRFQRLPKAGGARTLFANPDLSVNTPNVVNRAIAAGKLAGLATDLPLVVLPAGGVVNASLADAAALAKPSAIMATTVTSPGLVTPGPHGVAVVSATMFSAQTTDSVDVQNSLSEALLDGGQIRLLSTTNDLALDKAATTAWTHQVPLGDVLRQPPVGKKTSYAKAAEPATLSAAQQTDVSSAASDLTLYDDAVPGALLKGQENPTTSRLASTAWIGYAGARTTYRSTLMSYADARALKRGISLNVSPRVIMSSRHNEFPITVTNTLDVPVMVKVIVTTDDETRLTIPDSDVVEVQPGVSQTLSMGPEATSNGVDVARVQATTPSGLELTPATSVTVEITNLGFIAWIIVIASGGLLIGLTIFRIHQVAHGAPRHTIKDAPSAQPLPSVAKAQPRRARASSIHGGQA